MLVKKRKAPLDSNEETKEIHKKRSKKELRAEPKKDIHVLLAQSWDPIKHNPTGWWISEKLDGLRAFWDGKHFYSRLGHRFPAPDFVLQGMPADVVLDGELFSKRGEFQSITSIVRSSKSGEKWKALKFHCFDAPEYKGRFEDRMAFVQALVAKASLQETKSSFLVAHPHVRCESVNHLQTELKRVESENGEGLMIREPGSAYVPKRSSTLLKVKSMQRDEFKIVGHLPGKGKYTGKLGGYLCTTNDGQEFGVGSGLTDVQRDAPLCVGTLITVQFQELSKDKIPRFPIFIGEAIDKT